MYKRGAGFIYELQQSMGQERFFAFMRDYYAKYYLSEATTDDFVATLAPYIVENQPAKALCRRNLNAWND